MPLFSPPLQAGNWTASDQGLIAWNYDTGAIAPGGSAPLATAGKMYTMGVPLRSAASITNIIIGITTIGNTLTSGQCFAALYQGAGGALLGVTADQSTNWVTGSPTYAVTAAIAGGPVVAAAGILQVGLWFNGTTGPAPARTSGTTNLMNVGLASSASRWGTANTGLTTTAPGTLGTITSTGSIAAYWAGLS